MKLRRGARYVRTGPIGELMSATMISPDRSMHYALCVVSNLEMVQMRAKSDALGTPSFVAAWRDKCQVHPRPAWPIEVRVRFYPPMEER